MKILFLDHQGVMHLKKWTKKLPSLEPFDIDSIFVLNQIIQETDCEIVVSSDWKLWTDLKGMQKFYTDQGILKAPISYTPKYEIYDIRILPEQRSREIKGWIDQNPVNKWVSVDDLDMRPYLENFVFISDTSLGIKSEGVKDSIIGYLD